jgi:potassium efflux system protein
MNSKTPPFFKKARPAGGKFILSLIFLSFLGSSLPAQQRSILPISENKPANHAEQDQGATEQLDWSQQKLSELQAMLRNMESGTTRDRIASAGLPQINIDDFLGKLHSTIRSYSAAVDVLEGVIRAEAALAPDAKPIPAPPTPQTPDEALNLRAHIIDLKSRLEGRETDYRLDAEMLRRANSLMQEARSRQALAAENFHNAQDDASLPAAVTSEYADLVLQDAAAALFLAHWRSYRLQLEKQILQNEIDSAEDVLRRSGYANLLNESLVEARKNQIATLQQDLNTRLERAKAAAARADQTMEGKRNALQQLAEDSQPEARTAAEQQLDLARFYAQAAEGLVRTLETRLALSDQELRSWDDAAEILTTTNPQRLEQMRQTSESLVTLIHDFVPELERNFSSASMLLTKIRTAPAGGGETQSMREMGTLATEERLDDFRALRDQMAILEALQQAMIQQTTAILQDLTLREKIRMGFSSIAETALGVWHFQIFSSEAGNFTVGRVLLVSLGLLAAFLVSRIISGHMGRVLRGRRGVTESHAAFVEKLGFYLLLVVFFLTLLNWLQIPLTVFAFMGGALAIGIGFGAQNLINNFISGLLLLIERKIRVGDLVQVDGFTGRVTDLGSRCSSIRTFDGMEVLVPNSHLLERNVTNWTMSDPQHRFDFTVGVAYGSPLEKVMAVFQQAMDEQPELLKDPPPVVFFENFGESALEFRFYYWLAIGSCDGRKVGSDIRLRIDRYCRNAGIEIAFPQRDIHLHATNPLPVVVKPASPL